MQHTTLTPPPLLVSDGDTELPYNTLNRLIQPADVERLLSEYGITMKPKMIDVYRKAFVHRSYCTRKNENILNGNEQCPDDCIPLQEDSYERLEFLGDSVLGLVVGKYLFERYPFENEGFLTKMRTKLVNGTMLASLSKTLGLDAYVLLSHQIEANEGRKNKNILEDVFESFIAAIFIDFNQKKLVSKALPQTAMDMSGLGFQIAEQWIIRVIETHVDFVELIKTNQNYKDSLIKYTQHTYQFTPRFLELDQTYNDALGKRTFTVCVKNSKGQQLGVGKAESKKKAEQIAAYYALVYYGEINAKETPCDI